MDVPHRLTVDVPTVLSHPLMFQNPLFSHPLICRNTLLNFSYQTSDQRVFASTIGAGELPHPLRQVS